MRAFRENFRASISIPIAVFLVFVVYVAMNKTNIPIMDDYDSILKFLITYETDTSRDMLYIFKTHNEHFLAIPNILVLFHYSFFGDINFKTLTIFALLLLVAIAWLVSDLQKRFTGKSKKILTQLPILSLGLGSVLVWPMASLQHISTVLFSSLTFAAFSRKYKYLIKLRYMLLFLSCFTGGGSIVIIPLLIYGNLMVKNVKWRYLIANSLLVVVIFFSLSPGRNLKLHPIDQFFFFLNFLGNPFNTINSILFGWLLLFLITFTVFTLVKNQSKLQSTVIFQQILGFNLAMGVFSALSRIDGGRSYGTEEKYFLYSVMCWIMVFIIIQTVVRPKELNNYSLLVSSLCLLIFLLNFFSKFELINKLMEVTGVLYPANIVAIEILEQASKLGIYQP